MPIERTVSFTLNGTNVTAEVKSHQTIVEVLQSQFGLTGARESCAQGLCGCCTILVNGRAVSGCLYLAYFAEGAEISTIEGVATPEALDPVQQAFIDAGAFQCGYCTPGFVLMAKQLLDDHPEPDETTIRHYLSGNLCRCATYPEIIQAIKNVAQRRREEQGA